MPLTSGTCDRCGKVVHKGHYAEYCDGGIFCLDCDADDREASIQEEIRELKAEINDLEKRISVLNYKLKYIRL